MGRPTEGWKLRPPKELGGNYTVRFTHPKTKERIERSTDESDPGKASEKAALIYARALTIGAQPGKRRVDPFLTLDELFAMCLSDMSKIRDADTIETHTQRAKRFVEFFDNDLMNVHRARLADYQRERLQYVLKGTLQKEQSTLNILLTWLVEQNVLDEENMPAWPMLDSKVTGVRTGPQRATPVDLTIDEVWRYLFAFPVWTKRSRHTKKPVVVRARFIVAYQTAFRPATIATLRLAEHWKRGAREIALTSEVDKIRFGRTVPITAICAEALEWVAEACGLEDGDLLFGDHDLRHWYKLAATAAELPRAAEVAPYDLRHGRTGHLVDESADMRAVAFLVGHKRLTTTDKYLRAQQRNALSVVSAQDRSGGVRGAGEDAMKSMLEDTSKPSVRRRGLEPLRVTPLVPETSANAGFTEASETRNGPDRPRKVLTGQGSGDIPKTLMGAALGLALHRIPDDAMEEFLASELLDETGEGS